MRVLFTDIDGCLNSAQSAEMYFGFLQEAKADLISFKDKDGPHGCGAFEICPIAVSNYHYILKQVPDLKIVISSAWRLGRTLDELKEIFTWIGLPADRIVGKTPTTNFFWRGAEIMDWLGKNPDVTEYAILDDEDDMNGTKEGSLFLCNSYNGLIYTQAMDIIKYFEPNKWEK